MDYANVNFNSSYEVSQNLIEPLRFETLLLEVECNLPVISEKTIRKQFELDLQSRITEAREIFDANIKNMTKHARQTRATH